jgi:hypothetical protein
MVTRIPITDLQAVTPCSMVDTKFSGEYTASIFQNIDKYLPDFTESHTNRIVILTDICNLFLKQSQPFFLVSPFF